MKSRLFLNVVVSKGAAILQLLSSKDETLLVWRDTLLVLNLGLHVVDGVRALNFKRDGLASKGFYKDLHATTKTEDKVEGGLFLDVIICKSAAIFKLLASEDEALLIGGDTFFVLDLGLDIVNSVGALHFEGDSLAGEGLDEDLHVGDDREEKRSQKR
ncbi:hypothetical protein L7F22_014717 [Adiantum nelumboides]|nr:hypothetical protein [Adiantum nelumboides]